MSFPDFLTAEIQDLYLRENFKRMNQLLRLPSASLLNFKHLKLTITDASADQVFPHGLGYKPEDLIVSRESGPGQVQFNYDDFDKTNISLSIVAGTPTVDNPSVIYCFVGTHQEGL